MPLLDDELITPQGSDKGFWSKLVKLQASNPVFDRVPRKKALFVVRHYAGEVTYNSTDFLDKNRDSLTQDLVKLLQSSNHPFVQEL